MKRIFLCFPIAKECNVKKPITPVTHNLAQEKRQKDGHHVPMLSQVL